MIKSILKASEGKPVVQMEDHIQEATDELRTFLFNRVYNDGRIYQEEMRADKMISALYEYYKKNTNELPEFFRGRLEVDDIDTVLCDFISGFSDTFAIKTFSQKFVPNKWTL